jgi:hypothetical protein
MLADAVHGPQYHRQDGGLDAEEQGTDHRALDAQAGIEPGERQHQDEARQHEAEPGEQAAEAAFGADAKMDAKLVGLGSGEHLHHRQQLVEAGAADPLFLVDQLMADHRNLCDRAAKGHEAEAQEAGEQSPIAELGRARLGGFGRHAVTFSGKPERLFRAAGWRVRNRPFRNCRR